MKEYEESEMGRAERDRRSALQEAEIHRALKEEEHDQERREYERRKAEAARRTHLEFLRRQQRRKIEY